jgi:hypothetical protein
MELVAIVTVIALLEYFWLGVRVGQARGRYSIEAPATTGHPVFERHFRVHQNTMENLVIFIPALWLAATYSSARIAALVGLFFPLGRIVYALRYVEEPKKRGPGVLISLGATAILLVMGLVGAIARLL